MVELTHGGTWLKWNSLSRRDRNWALLSFVTSGLAMVPVAIAAGEWGYRLGYRAGSGGQEVTATGATAFHSSDLFACLTLAAAIFAMVSAWAWWRFSRNQDELFNRIQNHAIGQAGGWTLAVALVWWILSLGGWVGALPLAALVVFGTALLIAFWLAGVRRWL